jgi:hypothetical protein
MFWQLFVLDRLGSKADAANAELKRIRQELDFVHREQQQEREERPAGTTRRGGPTKGGGPTKAGTALVFVMFVAALGLASWWTLVHTTPYEPPKSNQSTSNIQSADPNAQTPGTPVTDTKKRGGKFH